MFRPIKVLLAIVLICIMGLPFYSCQSAEKKEVNNLQGTFSLEGNEPFTALIFISKQGRYVLVDKQKQKWMHMQNKKIVINGILYETGPVGAFMHTNGKIEILSVTK